MTQILGKKNKGKYSAETGFGNTVLIDHRDYFSKCSLCLKEHRNLNCFPFISFYHNVTGWKK